ncbi:hypothetical protein [Halolamina salifodinae]|uniref:Uncharacterized protein n=1 Tax=Halolamina salifodinae TaxID=1202767 RepID=A0A8T4GSN9_9EURY|nr:hypothetical protein [Halolamina salifodinae]MBP1986111.1 hypothetical protein [Halolamina salifodinae]
MQGKHIAIAAAVLVVVVGGIAGALVTGFGPAPGGDGGGLGGDSTATATPYENTVVVDSTGTESGGGGDGTATASQPDPFAFVIENISECGDTCRVVDASIVNQQDSAATGVTVRSEIYTGGDKIWEGSSDVGTLESGESYSDTKRVDLSYGEAYKVQQNDGKILIKTYVVTDGATYVFKDERDVS